MLFIHIGKRKTGTTTLQYFLSSQYAALDAQGIHYATIGRQGDNLAHHGMGAALFKRGRKNKTDPLVNWRLLASYCRDNPGQDVVISSEALESARPRPLVEILHGIPVKILCYVRNTAAHVQSNYSQSAKFGQCLRDFDHYFERLNSRGGLRCSPQIKRWADAFGAANVRVRSMDESILEGGDLIQDFFSGLGHHLASLQLPEIRMKNLNLSPGWQTVELIREAYCAQQAAGTLEKDLRRRQYAGKAGFQAAEAAGFPRDKGQYLTPEQAALCHQAYLDDIADLEASGLDVKIARPAAPSTTPRPFLPCAEAVEAGAAAAFRAAYGPLAEVLRQKMLARLGPAPSDGGEAALPPAPRLSREERRKAREARKARRERRAARGKGRGAGKRSAEASPPATDTATA